MLCVQCISMMTVKEVLKGTDVVTPQTNMGKASLLNGDDPLTS